MGVISPKSSRGSAHRALKKRTRLPKGDGERAVFVDRGHKTAEGIEITVSAASWVNGLGTV